MRWLTSVHTVHQEDVPRATGQMAADLASSQLKQMTGERELIATSPPTDKLSTGTVCDGTAADD